MDVVAVVELLAVLAVVFVVLALLWRMFAGAKRDRKNYERSLKMVPMLIHLPPSTDDIQGGGRDERDVTDEQLSEAQVMYSIIASTLTKGLKSRLYGQRHLSFEIVAHNGTIKYYAVVPAVLTDTVQQAITAAYPTARLEEVADPNFFNETGGVDAVAGGELRLKGDYWYPIASYQDSKRDASLALINALSIAKKGDGVGVQVMFRPTDGSWTQKSLQRVQNIREGKKARNASGNLVGRMVYNAGNLVGDVAQALWQPPEEHAAYKDTERILTNLEQEEIQRIEEKTRYPGFEVLIRICASSASRARSESLLQNVVAVFSQFDLTNYNGFRYDALKNSGTLAREYILRSFPQTQREMILNSVEMASLFHLPAQNSIPTSQVERQATKQVDGPAKIPEEGVILGVNKFRGEEKIIRLRDKDRRRHTYVIGSTGMGKSILLTNIAYQDMCDGRGFAFIDPHGDAVELLLSKVPPERMDDVILFEPGNLENPVGMNMFEFQNEDQKDFIVQEALNMLVSLYDPGNQGIFGPRAQHMFRNAALLLMSDPAGGTFIDVPRCFIDSEFVKSKLKYVTDKTVYDYWTKEFPASQRSSEAGEVVSWFVSKWGPFLSNKMMRNILGQPKSGFNIRQIMDDKKILLVNLSKGKTGELNAKLLGMIFVMKFQAAAMSRADTPEDEREDFCLFVDEFQNFATESFESILSEARKYRLNLILANQFMTQLTDKIREALLGNVGTLMSGRLGVTDAELMERAFAPVFTAEDLHKQPNFMAIATVMMFDMPTAPFTMNLLPPLGESNELLMRRMREYALSKHGRPRAEVEAEIDERLAASEEPRPAVTADAGGTTSATAQATTTTPGAEEAKPKESFLDSWLRRKAELDEKAKREARQAAAVDNQAAASKTAPQKLKERHEARKAQAVMNAPTAASEDKKAPDANSVSAAPAATKPAGPAVTEEDDGIVLRWR
ncbi:type IV secretory system conjugative DNA transfer family protein [Candidatus Saccharibacteria bacterium]|nr:type IV secretory system conjugative DNA transfer family protein [Candidatus Saccharibacteria bacterium]